MRRSALVAILALVLPATAQLVPRDGSPPIALRSQQVDALVEDGLARTSVRQTFVNPHDRALEAVFLFPLPADAALIDVAMEVGGQRLEGLLAERKLARQTYDGIVRAKRDPALVEQIGRECFRLSVFPVVPHEETVVELAFVQHLPLSEGAFRYVFPLALGGAPAAAGPELAITVRLRSAVAFSRVSASHDGARVVQLDAHEALVSLEESGAALDRDLVITAEVETAWPQLAVRTAGDGSGGGWFLAVVTPPRAADVEVLPRDVILVLDTSGSMAADGKLEQVQRAALWLLGQLRAEDRVDVLCFDSAVTAFAAEPVDATPENLLRLAEFVGGLRPKGSTALGDALRAVAELPACAGRVRTALLLSDGRPTVGECDPARLVELGRAAAGRGLRVFPFGVGSDVDSALLEGIALAGRGRAEVFRPGGEVETRLVAFLARTASPVIADLSLSVEGVDALDVLPRPLPDVYLGEQVAISGRYRGAGPGRVKVRATIAGSARQLVAAVDFPAEAGGSPLVAQLFARRKLAYLEAARRLRLGLADDAYYAALDSGAYSTAGEIEQELVEVSLAHGVQCAYTSFLVLLPEDRRRIDPRDAEALSAARQRVAEAVVRPRMKDAEVADHNEAVDDWSIAESEGDPGFDSDSPFDSDTFDNVLGIGGSAGGKFGVRRGARRNLKAGTGIEECLSEGEAWLQRSQSIEGYWSSDGALDATPDLGATALALLALLGEGNTTTEGEAKAAVAAGIQWLRAQQDLSTGRFAGGGGSESLYDHALATLALCEAYYASRSPLLERNAQAAVDRAVGAQSPDGAWRDEAEQAGGDPAALTAWMVLALAAAREAELEFDPLVFELTRTWVEAAAGEASSDPAHVAAILLARIFLAGAMGEELRDSALLERLAAELENATPAWDSSGAGCDLTAWCLGTYAMFQMGDRHWRAWEPSLKAAVVDSRVRSGDLGGSWDPIDPSPRASGRVRATALMTLSAEVYFRYPHLIGAR